MAKPGWMGSTGITDPRDPPDDVAATSFYRVAGGGSESDCKCQACIFWPIVFVENGENVEIGQSWQGVLGRDTADDICDLMNMAYEAGRESTSDSPP